MKQPISLDFLLALAIGIAASCVVPTGFAAALQSNPELAKLEAADQADRPLGSHKINWDVVGKRDALRRTQVFQLLRAGEIRTAADFYNASVIFQHGSSVDDTRLALAFATITVKMDSSNQDAVMLMADAWDRILLRSGKPQWYGTQYVRSKTTGKWILYRTDPTAITDAQRKRLRLPTLAQAKANAANFNK